VGTVPVMARFAALLLTVCALAGASVAAGSQSHSSARTLLPCLNHNGTQIVFRYKPTTCADFGPSGSNADSTLLRRLHWSSWGGAKAKARGVECGAHLPCEKIPAKVVASKPRTACGGRRVYTHLRVTTHFGTISLPLSCKVPGP
jgi:hypothetical protein